MPFIRYDKKVYRCSAKAAFLWVKVLAETEEPLFYYTADELETFQIIHRN